MNKLHLIPLLPCMLLLATGCSPESAADPADDQEDVAEVRGRLVSDNGLGPNGLGLNGLGPNGLGPNGLGPNGLGPNGLGPNGISADAFAAIQADSASGELSRQLLKYTVSCALTPNQSFAFSWVDSAGVTHDELYTGLLGIAPGWATAPLTDETEQRLVSACLAARVNYYGVNVYISLRSRLDPLRTKVQDAELADYPHVEGAFVGNLFTSNPHIYSCYYDANIALARSQDRDCAAGHVDENGDVVDCGPIEVLGSCADWCHNLDNHERWYHDCDDPADSTSTGAAIVVALP